MMRLDVGLTSNEVRVSRSAVIVWTGALATFALHVLLSGRYGYQRDELYFIACAKHLAWGYVDQPPLIALVADLSMRLFGDGLVMLRIFPALAAGGLAALAAHAAQRFGGGSFAQILTVLAIALSPFDLAIGSLLTMNAFEPLFWLYLTLLVFEQVDEPRRWRWLAIGAVVGVGILNKWSMGIYASALLLGVLASQARGAISPRGLGVAGFLAGLIIAPNVAWQAQHGWPQLEVLRNADSTKNEHVSAAMFLLMQLPLTNPFTAPVWLAGIVASLRSRRFAALGIAYVVLVAFELVCRGKVYYVAPIYPALLAVGAVAIERFTTAQPRFRIALTSGIIVAGFAIMPLATPALPLGVLLRYQHTFDVRSLKMEDHPIGRVPQQFADQLGWDELETTIAGVVDTLTPSERASAAILTGDYGQAAALDFLGRHDALPPVISGHNQYALWGPHGEHAVIVAVGVSRALLAREYRSIRQAATYRSPYVLPQNSNLPVYVCRDPRIPLARFWPQFRRYV